MKRNIFGLFLLFFSLTAIAADTPHPAEDVVRNTTTEVLAVLEKENDSQQVNRLVNDIILPNFDFTQMSRWTLGGEWNKLDADKQQLFANEFQKMLVHTYATALNEFDNQTVEVQSAKLGKNAKFAMVPTVITLSNADPLEIHYMMMESKNGWKVVDMSIGGVSLVKNYRASYAAQIRKDGVDALIEKLVSKNEVARL